MNRASIKLGEKALHMKGNATGSHYNKGMSLSFGSLLGDSRGRGRHPARGRGGRGRGYENRSNV